MKTMSLSDKYIKIGDLIEILGVSRSTIYKWVSEGYFPEPVHFGDARKNSTMRWVQQEVDNWLEDRPRKKTDE